jgi:hypothetical protein
LIVIARDMFEYIYCAVHPNAALMLCDAVIN